MYSSLQDYVLSYYKPEEMPCLYHQALEWRTTKPLSGLSIIDATPIFRNTLAKYWALLEAGAQLSVANTPLVIRDPEIVALLPQWGIGVCPDPENYNWDIVMDCAGVLSSIFPRLGSIELTRSGVEKYEDARFPVFMADAGRIKQIETMLGTGDGFLRAMQGLGYKDWRGKSLVLFGFGKVGMGVAYYMDQAGADLTIIDVEGKASYVPDHAEFIPLSDESRVYEACRKATCIVTATGVKYALQGLLPATEIIKSDTLLANVGVEDEWGPEYPTERILNNKHALNFLLEEPTQMCFIETTLALDNAGAVELKNGRCPEGISTPAESLESALLTCTRLHGIIGDKLDLI